MPEEENSADGEGSYTPPSSQEELDRIVGQRLARERAKFGDYDDLKAKAAKYDEADAASKTEQQKLQDAIAERDAKLADLPKQARKEAIRFASEASKRGFLDPEDALVFIDADLSDGEAVAAALDDLADRKPHLLRPEEKPKPKPPRTRPKPAAGETDEGDNDLSGKERAAAALRQFRNT